MTDNSFHVVKIAGRAVLDGFTVTAGYASGAAPNNNGAGIYGTCADKTLTLTNMIFNNNTASHFISTESYDGNGGGAYLERCPFIITHVSFNNNTAVGSGGGMFSYSSSSSVMEDVSFKGNSVSSASNSWYARGGGAYLESGTYTLTNILFNDNVAYFGGGYILVVVI